MPKPINKRNSAGMKPGGHVTEQILISHPQGRGSAPWIGAARKPQQPALAIARALTNAKVRRAMRAKFGPLAVVLLFVLSFCGCKSGSNMFASGAKRNPRAR